MTTWIVAAALAALAPKIDELKKPPVPVFGIPKQIHDPVDVRPIETDTCPIKEPKQ